MIFPCRRDKPAGTERDEKCSIRSHRITRWARKIAAVRAGDCCGPFFVRGSGHVVAKAHGAGMKRLRGERMMSPAIVLEVAVSNVRAAASPGDAHFRAFAAEQEKPFSKRFFFKRELVMHSAAPLIPRPMDPTHARQLPKSHTG